MAQVNNIDDECYGYCRCSKANVQDASYEINALMKLGIKRENIYVDYISGSNDNRENLNKVLNLMKSGKSSLFCTDITRLVRSTSFFCTLLSFFEENKLRLVIGSLDVDCRTEKLDVMVEGMLKINAVFGEMERKLKIFQINLGLSNARAEGTKLGRPKRLMKTYRKYSSSSCHCIRMALLTKLTSPILLVYPILLFISILA